MADGKVKKYFKNLRKMKEEGVNVPVPKKKAVVGKTNYGINWNKKTKVTTPPTGTGQTTKQKTRPADETRTKPFIQGGIGVTKQGKKPKKGDEIKQPPLESKHAGEVNLDNVEKVEYPFLRLTAKETSDESFKTKDNTTKHPMLAGAKEDDEYVLRKNGKNKTKTLAPIGGVAGVEMGTEAAQEAGIATTEGKNKIKTPAPEAEKKKKKKKLTEAVNVLSGKSIHSVMFGGKTEKKSKNNNKKKGR